MSNRVWYNLQINGADNKRSVFIDLINSFDEPKEAFLLHSELPDSISDWSTSEYIDWPTMDEDMREFSLKYTGVEFEFTCDDQDGSYWREWYKDGLAAYAESHIVHSEIEESMYS